MNDRPKADSANQEPCDRARRRLIKLGIYLTPTIISMTTFLRRSDAKPGSPQAQPGVSPSSQPNTHANAKITVN